MFDNFLGALRTGAGLAAGRRRWPRRLTRAVALLMILSLTLLTTLAANHHHDSSVETHHCLVCGVLADELSGTAKQTVPLPLWTLLHHTRRTAPVVRRHFAAPRLLPPSCGPPAA